MSYPVFVSDLGEAEVAEILSTPEISRRLDDRPGIGMRVTLLDDNTYKVAGSKGEFVVRFPRDKAHLSLLKREESIQRGLKGRITALIPDTRVIDGVDGCPALAIHRMIQGEPLESDCYDRLSPEARDRLIGDLVTFFWQTHAVELEAACEWLDIPFDGERTVAELASTRGKPIWFDPHAVAGMRPILAALLDDRQAALFDDTVRLFEALEADPAYMVFGHGDMHGYNMALAEDRLGPRFVGAFDLGCAGILDIHEDFFRLSLISEDLLERVIDTYQGLPGQTRRPERDRIAIYYRAFLFYLMAEVPHEALDHLKSMLQKHIDYYDATYGRLLEAGLRVRKARIEDSAGLARVQVDSYRTAYAGILPPTYLAHFTYAEQEQDWRDWISQEHDDLLYVVGTEAEEIVGYALGRSQTGGKNPYDSELIALHVRRPFQRRGIGRRLVATLAEQLHGHGCSSLMLWVLEGNPARSFYERLGGQMIEEQEWGGNAEFGVQIKEVAYGWSAIESLYA
jgi:ribosomal protein S18 acetylase RimI-like enzyme